MANTIQDKLAYLEETKEAIKQSIIAKGVSVSDEDTFRSYADKIETIETGGGTSDCSVSACFDEVGYTFVPVYIQEGLETAAQFKAAWNPENTSIDMTGYKDSTVFFPKIDTSKVTTLQSVFQDTSILVFPNNDFPSLNSTTSLYNTFNEASRLVSVDFGELADYEYVLWYTFAYCNNLERIFVHGENSSFKLWQGSFRNCSSLSDITQCNIFNYINTTDCNLDFTFYYSKLLRDFNFVNPISMNSSFYGCNLNDKSITLTYNDYSNTDISYYTTTFYNATSVKEPSNTLKITGKLTVQMSNNRMFANALYSGVIPLFNKLDVSNLDYTNNYSGTSTSNNYGIVDYLNCYYLEGLDTLTESFPSLPEKVYHKAYLFPKILANNCLVELPKNIETYWNKIKDKMANVAWGKSSAPFISNLYRISGTIDLSFLDVKIASDATYAINNVGSNKSSGNVTLRLDSVDWSELVNASSSNIMKSNYIEALYTPFNFDSCTSGVNVSGLTNWTDHDSLIWSLLTNSTDRAAQSLGTQTIRLSANSYNALTDDERSQIEAKGYTLTHQ